MMQAFKVNFILEINKQLNKFNTVKLFKHFSKTKFIFSKLFYLKKCLKNQNSY